MPATTHDNVANPVGISFSLASAIHKKAMNTDLKVGGKATGSVNLYTANQRVCFVEEDDIKNSVIKLLAVRKVDLSTVIETVFSGLETTLLKTNKPKPQPKRFINLRRLFSNSEGDDVDTSILGYLEENQKTLYSSFFSKEDLIRDQILEAIVATIDVTMKNLEANSAIRGTVAARLEVISGFSFTGYDSKLIPQVFIKARGQLFHIQDENLVSLVDKGFESCLVMDNAYELRTSL